MPLAVLHSRSLSGLDAPPVAVEVHLATGLPAFNLVGLPDTEVKEALRTMVDGGFRHLPVTEDGKVVGMVSIRDVAGAMAD